MSNRTGIIKKLAVGAAGLSAVLSAEMLFVFRYGFRKANDVLMKFWSKHNKTPEEAKDLIRQGCRWLKEQDVEEVSVTSFDGLTLRGHFLKNPDEKRVLIAFHGYRSNAYYDFGAQLRYLYDAGCSILLAEQRAHLCSDGEYVDMGILARRDVITWTEFVNDRYAPGRSEQEESPSFQSFPKIVLAGVSMGAATILMAQDQGLPDNVGGMIADCGFANTWEEVRYFGSHYGVIFSAQKMPFIDYLCRTRAGYSLRDANPEDALKKAKIPVLFFHGTDDTLMPIQNSYDNYEACAAPKKLVVVEGAEHAQSYFTDPELYEREVRAFLESV